MLTAAAESEREIDTRLEREIVGVELACYPYRCLLLVVFMIAGTVRSMFYVLLLLMVNVYCFPVLD